MMDPLASLSAALHESVEAAALLFETLAASEQSQAGALALHLGRPGLALVWSQEPLLCAAAALRRGEAERALAELAPLPPSARTLVLRARAEHQLGHTAALEWTQQARAQARTEGDGGALVAAAVLLAEQEWAGGAPPHAPLRTLAEGLKVAELSAQPADAHLLAVLAHVQARLNPRKGQLTAHKALGRSAPRGPARVLALLALHRVQEAQAEAAGGELAPVWWQAFGHGAA